MWPTVLNIGYQVMDTKLWISDAQMTMILSAFIEVSQPYFDGHHPANFEHERID